MNIRGFALSVKQPSLFKGWGTTMHHVYAAAIENMSAQERAGMFRLRYETFSQRLGWDVNTAEGMETDIFDSLGGVYIIAKSDDSEVDACWRLLPTTGPYMLRDTFPELLHGKPAPAALDTWELSRFAVATHRMSSASSGFGPLSVSLMAVAASFAQERGIVRYVTVTTLPIERLLKRLGVNIQRVGPPIKIGVVWTVACNIEVDSITLKAVAVH